MEQVFWLMWLADVSSNVGVIACIGLFVAFGAVGFAAVLEAFDGEGAARQLFLVLRWFAIPVILAVVLPSSTTIRLLAVASAGEAATQTALGQKGVEALNAVLDKVIKESKK